MGRRRDDEPVLRVRFDFYSSHNILRMFQCYLDYREQAEKLFSPLAKAELSLRPLSPLTRFNVALMPPPPPPPHTSDRFLFPILPFVLPFVHFTPLRGSLWFKFKGVKQVVFICQVKRKRVNEHIWKKIVFKFFVVEKENVCRAFFYSCKKEKIAIRKISFMQYIISDICVQICDSVISINTSQRVALINELFPRGL